MLALIKQLCSALLLFMVMGNTRPLPEWPGKMRVADFENVLGTSMQIKIVAGSEQAAAGAEAAALAEIDRLNRVLSGYDATSEFCRWMQAAKEPQRVSPELYEVLALFEQWRSNSHGALDAAAATISQVWKEAARQNRLPATAELNRAVLAVQQPHYTLDEKNHTARRLSDAPLILNSFAKTYIMNKAAAAALTLPGVSGLVINIGGDILVRGSHTEPVQINDPRADAENDLPLAGVDVCNKTIATSGNYRRGERIGGKWYSHIVDPRTGWPASGVISATVVADSATDAGALATALNVVGPEEGRRLVASIPGAGYLLVTSDGKRIASKGWKSRKITAPKPGTATAIRQKDKPWDPDYEVVVNLQLATMEGMRAHRPFVAVWVEDEYKKPVKQLAVWYGKARWLNEMRSWHYAYYQGFSSGSSNIMSTTGATRPPGKYTLKWDGKDDQGNYVQQGTYTVYIEAAREQGTHQLMSRKITAEKPQHYDLAGNAEISTASLDYRKKTGAN